MTYRYMYIPPFKVIGGRRWYPLSERATFTRKEAQEAAKKERKRGYNARVIEVGLYGRYMVFTLHKRRAKVTERPFD